MANRAANPGSKVAATGALYLYGISRGGTAKGAEKPAAKPARPVKNKPVTKTQNFLLDWERSAAPGIDGVHEVRPLVCGEFICWVCEVDQTGFSEALESNMENLEWLALHGVRHQQVVG